MLKNDDYVYDMRDDDYYPPHLVQKVADELRKFDELLEAGERDPQKIQARADEVTKNINTLADEFDEEDSEIETVARESIAETFYLILKEYGLEEDFDIEELIAERDW
ncbi:hypothetical protein HMPREF0742_02565 [Rothia aeria F0184]|uniref:Uncharacterized protein n=1 Tax=Rothia aeria F0184 TaxID=888019 RepID=U7UYB1_9MICC|nr:DUF5713 family protein [Rothia aeria]ERT63889.1 hypothetical protein HMPREF0742_02565 [Rothia aeria F0184]